VPSKVLMPPYDSPQFVLLRQLLMQGLHPASSLPAPEQVGGWVGACLLACVCMCACVCDRCID